MEHQQETRGREHYLKTYQFDVNVAQEYGVDESIILRHLQFWIKTNRANGDHFHNGRTWHYGSVRSFAELWPFWTPKHISRKLNGLIKAGVLVKGNYNHAGYDRTLWYAFKDEKSWFLSRDAIIHKRQMEGTKRGNGLAKSGEPIPIPSQDKKPHINKPIEKSPQEILGLDLQIAEQKKFLAEQLQKNFHYFTKGEKRTFARIIDHLVRLAQQDSKNLHLFKDAVEWSRQAATSNAANKKGLFVAKVKQETGFKGQKQMLTRKV